MGKNVLNTLRVDACSSKVQEKNHRFQYYPCIRGDEVVLLTQTFMVCLILKPAFNGTWAKSPYKTLLQSSRVIFPDSRPTLALRLESVLLIANNRNGRNDSLLKTVPYCNSIKHRLTTILHSPPVLRISTVQHSPLTQGSAENFHLISPVKTLQIRKMALTINKYEKQFDGFKAISSYVNINIIISFSLVTGKCWLVRQNKDI